MFTKGDEILQILDISRWKKRVKVVTSMPSALAQCLKPDLKDGLLQMLLMAGLPSNLKLESADSCTSMER